MKEDLKNIVLIDEMYAKLGERKKVPKKLEYNIDLHIRSIAHLSGPPKNARL